ncbi:unnamed protein product [Paramecium primaurelia]|uniref:DNA-directed RNA polymerase subunit n=1 Tax=Paramecium primaurelia TaxID=5886 RepID=A0A8S1KZN8_PARPR|nr:unnamed protein product [Paramecium primaurelia]
MNFCPVCSNFLSLENESSSGYRLKCPGCIYYYPLKEMRLTKTFQSKEPAPITYPQQNKQITDEQCDKCGCLKAFFWEFQTRGADEQSTISFECIKCGHKWKNDR